MGRKPPRLPIYARWPCFGAEFESLKKLGQDLINKGEKMYYRRDLSRLFRD